MAKTPRKKQTEPKNVFERFKDKHPNWFSLFLALWSIVFIMIGYFMNISINLWLYSDPSLTYNSAGDFLGIHISSYNIYMNETPINLTKGYYYTLDVQIQNKYTLPVLSLYNFTYIDGLSINVRYNGKPINDTIPIDSSWNHFYLDTYVNQSAKEGGYEFCFTVKEALEHRQINYETACRNITIIPREEPKE